jgi:acyl-CoA thioesterase FadM
VVEILVRVWQTLRTNKVTRQLEVISDQQGEILSKVTIMFFMLKAKPPKSAEMTDRFEAVSDDLHSQ